MLTPLRTCYDVIYYQLDIKVDPESKSIEGSNKIKFTVVTAFDKMQVDLFENMHIEDITLDGVGSVPFEREYDAVFIQFPMTLRVDSEHEITVFYSGEPTVAKRPPWEGGFTWTIDKEGNPWIAVSCQEIGASLWWPNKDHQSDEPDSMMISVTVPEGLTNVSNGRLRSKTALPDGWTRYDWFISYPINNYNVTLNIGKYAHFRDIYDTGDTLTLDYFVMPYNLEKAKKQFQQVKPMIACFEKFFGNYPFQNDGFKLIETPYLGMEHQSAIAYGNNYMQGYNGITWSEIGLSFDFIIVHESAHEWWGNSVTSKDIADLWIHESFGAYAEAVYVECMHGYKEALTYINGKKSRVSNKEPIIGVYGVHKRGSRDMYNKGQLVLNTLRHVLDDDLLWWDVIYGIATEFAYQTIHADDIVNYVNEKTGSDFTYFFEQYLKYPTIPQLVISVAKKDTSVTARYKWNADVEDFRMPIKVTTSKHKYEFISPTTSWQSIRLHDIKPEDFRVAEDLFYVDVELRPVYIDPNKPDYKGESPP
ncbi:MAG: M1 family metallopeptidase [Bacteroidota bacterium]